MYQSPRQHTEDARRVLGDDVLMAIPATRTRSWAVFNMDRWHPPLLVFYAERVDVHLGRFVRTGPGHLLSTTPLAEFVVAPAGYSFTAVTSPLAAAALISSGEVSSVR